MNKLSQKITIGVATVGALASLVGATMIPTTLASTNSSNNQGAAQNHRPGMMWRKGGPDMGEGIEFDKNVTRSVQNITNGVQISLTSTDAATVTKLQAFKVPQGPQKANENANQNANKPNISVTKTDITNGIQLTVTSTDAATVTKLQTNAPNAKGFDFGFGFGRERGPRRGMGMFGPIFDKNVTHSVQNLSNGVQITLTSTDAATVTKLQDAAAQMEKMEAAHDNATSGTQAPAGNSSTPTQQ